MTDDREFVYTPADFLGWALASGWRPSTLPIGVIFTFQSPMTRLLYEQVDRFVENRELTVSNAQTFMTSDDGPAVLISCLNPGGSSMATQLEHLRFLGGTTRYAGIVGTAGGLTRDHSIADTVIVGSALRTDAVSHRYLPPAPTVDGDADLATTLSSALGVEAAPATTWTVPVPYRSTPAELEAALGRGATVVEMEIATLFAVAAALDYRATAAVVISDVSRVEGWEVDWSDTLEPTMAALDAMIAAFRR